jgi:hypothetical protein
MWKPRLDFIALHCEISVRFIARGPAYLDRLARRADAWITFASLLALVVIYPYGNVSAIDALFFGASSATESGLNT